MIKRFTFLLFVVVCYTTILLPGERSIIEGELIIQLKSNVLPGSFESSFSNIDLRSSRPLSKRMNIWLFKYNTQKISAEDVLFPIRQDKRVKVVQFNHYVQMRSGNGIMENFPSDPMFDQQWALNNTGQSGGTPDADIDAPEAWDITTGGLTILGDTIVIAIVDGGCDLYHEDLTYWHNYAEIPGNGIDDDNNGYIDDYRGWNAYGNNGIIPSDYHGTHVAGITSARGNNNYGVAGVNWSAQVMPVAAASGTEAVVVAGYSYVLEMRARYNETSGAEGAFIVATNASFGVDYGHPENYPIWCAIYDSLGAQGVLSCAATANLNINVDEMGDVPTACPSSFLISVTNTTRDDLKNNGAAYGLQSIDLGAPGTSILSTVPANSYANLTGTSMSTPEVTGAIALMFAAADSSLMQSYKNDPSSVALQFREDLLSSVDPVPALEGITVTGGRLNVFNAAAKVSYSVTPVELLSFNAASKESAVILNWTTATELNNKEFEVERASLDAATGIRRGFISVASIRGSGNSTEKNIYTFEDDKLDPGIYIYRLRQFDFGGTSEFSNEIRVEVKPPDHFMLLQNYPNPFNPATTINFVLPEAADVTISIYNVTGELVRTAAESKFNEGYQSVHFNASGLSSGVYIYGIEAKGAGSNFTALKKMLFLK